MKVEIQVISRNVISPSSPTPNDLKFFKFSYLDQLNPSHLMPHILFYKKDDKLSNSEIASGLKTSLSQTLSLYYPLAGRLVGNIGVKCSDEGINYVEAQANCNVLDVVNEHVAEDLSKFLPCDLGGVTDRCLAIQTTFFTCGGLAIAVAISHKLADAWSVLMFVNSWAAISCGKTNVPSPKLNSATIFPPRDLVERKPGDEKVTKEDVITKRFLFTSKKIDELKDKYTKEKLVRPTRIQALSAFIWTRFMVSTQIKDNSTKICTIFHAVGIRKRAIPPLPNDLFGNVYLPAITVPSLGDDEEEVSYDIVEKMQKAIHSIDGDYVGKVREGNDPLGIMNNQSKEVLLNADVMRFVFSSLCGLPLYEADFGWGKPLLIGLASLNQNLVIFMDSCSGGGIDAWVSLKSEHMAKFEADEELLAYLAN